MGDCIFCEWRAGRVARSALAAWIREGCRQDGPWVCAECDARADDDLDRELIDALEAEKMTLAKQLGVLLGRLN